VTDYVGISVNLLAFLAVMGLAVLGYALGGLVGLGVGLLALPLAYAGVILACVVWAW